MVRDLIAETAGGSPTAAPKPPTDIRNLGASVADFSAGMARSRPPPSKRFLHQRMYRHYGLNRMSQRRAGWCASCFGCSSPKPRMPARRMARGAKGGPPTPSVLAFVADYLAGMTDRFALDEHRRLFDNL